MSRFSIIDLYLTSKTFLHEDITKTGFNSQSIEIIKNLNRIKDEEIEALGLIDSEGCYNAPSEYKELVDTFCSEDFCRYIELFREYYTKKVSICWQFLPIKLLVISISICKTEWTESDNYISQIIRYMITIINKDDFIQFRGSANRLLVLSRTLKDFSISPQMYSFVSEHLYNDSKNFISNCYNKNDLYFMTKIATEDAPFLFLESFITSNLALSDIYKIISQKNHSLYWFYYYKAQYLTAMKNEDCVIAIKILSKAIAYNKVFIYAFNTSRIETYIEREVRLKNIVNIFYAIVIFSISSLSQFRKVGMRNLFTYYKLKSPLDITTLDFDEYDEYIISYFLYEICTIDNLINLYKLYKTEEEIEEYRIKICDFLIANYPNRYKALCLAEISDILKEQSLRTRRNAIDSFKISIGKDSIHNNIFWDFDDKVTEYRYCPEDKKQIVNNNSIHLESKINKVSDQLPSKSVKKRTLLLRDLYYIYAQEFCFGSMGLDSYLSTRIRHGSFYNRLSSVLSRNNLDSANNAFISGLIEKIL